MKFGFTVLFVRNVPASVAFYERAFGLKCRTIDEAGHYAELETGETTLALTQAEFVSELIPGGFQANSARALPPGFQIALLPNDVRRAFAKAVRAGARPVSNPEVNAWGYLSAMVRDPDGILVELAKQLTDAEVTTETGGELVPNEDKNS